MTNKQQQQQFNEIARDPLAFLIKAVGGTSKPRPCDINDHVAFTPNQHAKQVRALRKAQKAVR